MWVPGIKLATEGALQRGKFQATHIWELVNKFLYIGLSRVRLSA